MARILPLIVFFTFAMLAASALLHGGGAPRPPDVMTGQPVPSAVISGMPEGYLQDRTVLVNFFASWCAPCADEQPVLAMIAADTGVPIAGVVYKDRPEDVSAWLERHGNPFAIIGFDETGAKAIDWGVYGVPETFLVQSGTIVWRHVGPLDAQTYRRDLLPRLRGAKEP